MRKKESFAQRIPQERKDEIERLWKAKKNIKLCKSPNRRFIQKNGGRFYSNEYKQIIYHYDAWTFNVRGELWEMEKRKNVGKSFRLWAEGRREKKQGKKKVN